MAWLKTCLVSEDVTVSQRAGAGGHSRRERLWQFPWDRCGSAGEEAWVAGGHRALGKWVAGYSTHPT